jgi:hypothetical protein
MTKPVPKIGRPLAFDNPQDLLDWFLKGSLKESYKESDKIITMKLLEGYNITCGTIKVD